MNKWEEKVKKIMDEVLKEIKPTPEDTANMLANVSRISKIIKDELGDDVKIVLGGSVGKGTNLR